MLKIFDFCENSRVIKELAPQESEGINLNGWDYNPKPNLPYQRSFMVTLYGMRWYLDSSGLILTTDAGKNVGRLLQFYREHRKYRPFLLHHEYLGAIECRFKQPVNPNEASPNSDGLVEKVEIEMIHHNPGYE
jgi:hypothetical protein